MLEASNTTIFQSEITRLKNLRTLQLSSNKLTSITRKIGQMSVTNLMLVGNAQLENKLKVTDDWSQILMFRRICSAEKALEIFLEKEDLGIPASSIMKVGWGAVGNW
mmetsp:Transcript_7834/g.19198  ORF Transcript_7834/g.19198 Transcript_7834/m.19198 type:complete len:107 (-) Transcript_7834:227-547(-)